MSEDQTNSTDSPNDQHSDGGGNALQGEAYEEQSGISQDASSQKPRVKGSHRKGTPPTIKWL